jgi:ankyrin repeat protein
MAMRQLQSELLDVLSMGKDDQKNIIKRLDKIIRISGIGSIEKWRNSTNNKSNSFLHELVERELSDVICFVVKEHKLNINIKRESDGWTPLQLASKKQNSEMCNLLKKIGASKVETADILERPMENQQAMNIVWLDLEMTCIENPEILECAVIITDKNLNELIRRKSFFILL